MTPITLLSIVAYDGYGSRLLPMHPVCLDDCPGFEDEFSGNLVVCPCYVLEELNGTCTAHRCCSKLLVQLVRYCSFFSVAFTNELIMALQRRLVHTNGFRSDLYSSDDRQSSWKPSLPGTCSTHVSRLLCHTHKADFLPQGYTAVGGTNWIDVDTVTYNKSLILTWNYAYGGATIDASLVTPYEPTVLSMTDQVNQFLTGAALKPASAPWTSANSLFSFWIGINDIGNSYYAYADPDE